METYKYVGKVSMRLKPEAEYFFVEATFNQVYTDCLFFLNKARESGIKEEDKDRYARVSILFAAFYIESLSNRLWDAFPARSEKRLDSAGKDLREPVKKFRAVYHKFCQTHLPLNTDGIEDIFTIRNKIFAHPRAFSIKAGKGIPIGRGCDNRINYKNKNFATFPYVYSLFKTQHAKAIVNEVKNFLNGYCDLLKGKIPDNILVAIRPK
jgi:hypothetical protein